MNLENLPLQRRRNILFLTHRVPFPPNKGDKIRTFHQLEYLAERNNVYCACFVDRPGDAVHAIALRQWCADVIALPWDRGVGAQRALAGFVAGRNLTCSAYDDPEMWELLRSWTRTVDFDTVVAFSACMAPYAWSFPSQRRVLDLCDVDSRKWFDYAAGSRFPVSAAYLTEARRLAVFETRCVRHFDATILATQREHDLVDADRELRRVHVVPNGVDLPGSLPDRPSSNGPVMTFVGAMNYRPNVDGVMWFARRVWPQVRRVVPDARFVIVGADPASRIRRLANDRGIVVTGAVPSIQPYLQSSRVVIAPMPIVRGIPNKVLEAMAAARPVVAPSAVAEAIDAKSGEHLMTADSPDAFAEGVLQLLSGDAGCDRIAAAGRRFVASHYRWSDILEHFERIVIGKRTEPFRRPAFPPLKDTSKKERELGLVR